MSSGANSETVALFSVGQLKSSLDNPRKTMDEGTLAQLTDSIKQLGVQVPLLVRPGPGCFVIVAGHRRYAAAQRAGLKAPPWKEDAARADGPRGRHGQAALGRLPGRGRLSKGEVMRTRKTVLVVCDNEVRSDVLQRVLEARGGYRVATATAVAPVEESALLGVDLVIVEIGEDKRATATVDLIKDRAPETPILHILSGRAKASRATLVFAADAPIVELLEAARLLVIRKRGPKKAGSLRSRSTAVCA